jgi:hypothetical protein
MLFLGACTAAGTAVPAQLDIVELARGQHARGAGQQFELVTTAVRFAEVWRHIGDAPPTVDFERRSVIVLFMGQQSSGGHSVAATSVVSRGEVLHVMVRFRVPGAGCMSTTVLTSPYQVVSVPAGATRAEFTTETTAVACQ